MKQLGQATQDRFGDKLVGPPNRVDTPQGHRLAVYFEDDDPPTEAALAAWREEVAGHVPSGEDEVIQADSPPVPGPRGETGPPGPPGPKGDKGDTGPAGAVGVVSSSPQFYVPLVVSATAVLTNAPAAGVEPPGQVSRAVVDLRGAVNAQVQALASVAPAVTGVVRVEYSVNSGVNWSTLGESGAPVLANVFKAGTLVAVPDAAKTATTLLRVMVTGDAVADPVVQKAAVVFQPA